MLARGITKHMLPIKSYARITHGVSMIFPGFISFPVALDPYTLACYAATGRLM
jgi:hypothetical protein